LKEILPLKEREYVLHLATEFIHRALVGEESPAEELEQLLFRRRVARGDSRERVHPEGGFGAELRLYGFWRAKEVVLDEIVDVILVLREEDRLPRLVILRAPRTPAHLLHLHDRDGSEAEVHVEPVKVADDDPARGGVDTIGQSRSRNDALHPPPPELRLDKRSLVVR